MLRWEPSLLAPIQDLGVGHSTETLPVPQLSVQNPSAFLTQWGLESECGSQEGQGRLSSSPSVHPSPGPPPRTECHQVRFPPYKSPSGKLCAPGGPGPPVRTIATGLELRRDGTHRCFAPFREASFSLCCPEALIGTQDTAE